MVFNYTEEKLKELNAYWTATEILQQPKTWKKTFDQVKANKESLQTFINQVIKKQDYDVILTGAGTSEFVGNTLFSFLNTLTNHKAKSYATTDIVAYPTNYLSKTKPTLLVSFGRSGNSPESVAAVEVANAVCDNIYHLFVTCNHDGALSKFAKDKENCYALNLTPETHDQSFAMTSSFSNMYLATLLAFQLDYLKEIEQYIFVASKNSEKFLTKNFEAIKNIVDDFDFKRIVYLGSNSNKGIAQESALKMCELTAGVIVTMYDTPLGFRHGPKSIVDDTTLTVVYMSDEPYTRQYEFDLIKEMSIQRKANKILVLSSKQDDEVAKLVDYFVSFDNQVAMNNIYLGFEYITAAQIMALFKSLKMNITPDNPCPTGEVNRVVKGVNIYPYK